MSAASNFGYDYGLPPARNVLLLERAKLLMCRNLLLEDSLGPFFVLVQILAGGRLVLISWCTP